LIRREPVEAVPNSSAVAGEVEVVRAGQHQHVAAVYAHARPGPALDTPELAVQPARAQRIEVRPGLRVE
jgi:hypothetical protein